MERLPAKVPRELPRSWRRQRCSRRLRGFFCRNRSSATTRSAPRCGVVDSPDIPDSLRVSLLHLLRQVLIVEEEALCDAAIIVPEAEELDEADEAKKWERQQSLLSIDKEQGARQDIFAGWTDAYALAPKIVQSLCGQREHVLAALLCGCELLRDGKQQGASVDQQVDEGRAPTRTSSCSRATSCLPHVSSCATDDARLSERSPKNRSGWRSSPTACTRD